MRCFIALELTDELKEKMAKIQAELKETGADVKWVHPQQFHLTFHFFKDLSLNEIERLSGDIQKAIIGIGKFEMAVRGLGCFPSFREPRVIWIGLVSSNPLMNLFKIVNGICCAYHQDQKNQETQKSLIPHITIGRIRSIKNSSSLVEKIKKTENISIGVCKINQLTLFESKLTPKGPVYSELAHFSLSQLS